MHLCFVSTSRASPFMTELLETVAAAAAELGHETELALDRFPPHQSGRTYVVVPHEFEAWGDRSGFPDAEQRAHTIAFCTENPGTPWFEETAHLLAGYGAAVGINRSSVAELRRRGLRCAHLQLGYSPRWDTWHGDPGTRRDLDVLYLGAADPRRDPLLGAIGMDLWAHHCQFLVPPLEPRISTRPDFILGTEKYHRLRSARVLLNLHRTTSAALEWMRFLEAICNGCVVVSEPCRDGEPLIAGEHYITAPPEQLGATINALLAGSDLLEAVRQQSYRFVRDSLPMEPAAVTLVELAAELPSPTWRGAPQGAPGQQAGTAPAPASQPVGHAQIVTRTRRLPGVLAAALPRLSAGVRNRRRSRLVLCRRTSSAARKPRVSVLCVAARECIDDCLDALGGIAASTMRDLEVLVLDRAPAAPCARLEQFLDDHGDLSVSLLTQKVPCGDAAALNELARLARGRHLFPLDCRGGIFPSTLERLLEVLEADEDAAFAFPMVAVLDGVRPAGLDGALPWEAARLRNGNWIDAMSLIRRIAWLRAEGMPEDERLAGCEAYHLWCRFAEGGERGLHVPQVLAWRRLAPRSTSSEPSPEQSTILGERFPRLFVPRVAG